MAKIAGISSKRARLLNRLVRYLEVDNALELGTSLGMGTAAMAAGNDIRITTLEGCPETAAVAREKFKTFEFKDIELKVGEFEDFLVVSGQWSVVRTNSQLTPENRIVYGANFQSVTNRNSKFQIPNSIKKQPTTDSPQPTTPIPILNTKYSLLFIDGNHQKEATLAYFEKLLPTVHNDSVMIFDDIHWSKGMEEAWEIIKQHSEVRVTIDTFQWGLVFFRREQEKEHFVIRV